MRRQTENLFHVPVGISAEFTPYNTFKNLVQSHIYFFKSWGQSTPVLFRNVCVFVNIINFDRGKLLPNLT